MSDLLYSMNSYIYIRDIPKKYTLNYENEIMFDIGTEKQSHVLTGIDIQNPNYTHPSVILSNKETTIKFTNASEEEMHISTVDIIPDFPIHVYRDISDRIVYVIVYNREHM